MSQLSSPHQSLPSFWLAWTIVPLLLGPLAFVLIASTFGSMSQGRLSLSDVAGSFQTIYGLGAAPALIFGLPAAWYLRRNGRTSFGAFAAAGFLSGLIAGGAIGLFVSLLYGGSFLTRSEGGLVLWFGLFGSVSGVVWSLLVRLFSGRNAPDAEASSRLGSAIIAVAAISWVVCLVAGFSLAIVMNKDTAVIARVCLSTIIATQILAVALLAALAWFDKTSLQDWILGGAVAGLVASAYALNVPYPHMRFYGSPIPILIGGIAFGAAFALFSRELFRAVRSLAAPSAATMA